ncbi:MAG: hypothetical protein GY863_16745 [bacterium]|nr:hypothetical protein [bacterium]
MNDFNVRTDQVKTSYQNIYAGESCTWLGQTGLSLQNYEMKVIHRIVTGLTL